LCSSIIAGSAAVASTTNYVEIFGSTNLPPIDGGFFFIDNEYIDAPYHFSRTGVEIRVNGRLLPSSVPAEWPPRPASEIYSDPGNLDHLTAESTFDGFHEHWSDGKVVMGIGYRKLYNLAVNCSNETELAVQFSDWLASLPFVAGVSNGIYSDSDRPLGFAKITHWVAATTLGGEAWGINIWTDTIYNAQEMMSETVDVSVETTNWIEKLNRELLTYAHRLNEGYGLFIRSPPKGSPGMPDISPETMARVYPAWVAFMRSDMSETDKFRALQNYGFYRKSLDLEFAPLDYIGMFKASDQLEERLGALATQLGIQPLTTNDVINPRYTNTHVVVQEPRKALLFVGDASGGHANLPTANWYTNGTVVYVEAIASNGWEFVKWLNYGGIGFYTNTHDNPIRIVVESEMGIVPEFRKKEEPDTE
jgi:hypothetical protein